MPRLPSLAILLLLVFSAPAQAIPAPMSPEQLAAASDLVALVRVVSVTCLSVATDGRTGEKLPSYRAELRVLRVRKGTVREGQTITVSWDEIPRLVLGPWVVRYLPGEEVWTHLQYSGHDNAFTTTWWNAKGELLRPPDSDTLPVRPGETIRAKLTILSPLRQMVARVFGWRKSSGAP